MAVYGSRDNDNYVRLYLIFIENKLASYDILVEKISEKFKVKAIDPNILYETIEYIKKFVSQSYAKDMKNILDYMMADKKGDMKKILQLYPIVRDIESKVRIENSVIRSTNLNFNNMYNKYSKEPLETMKNDIDVVIKENRSPEELEKEGKISTKNLGNHASYFINKIEPRKYIKFLKIYRGLNCFSSIELNQYLEVLEYFCKYLDESVEKFNLLETEEEIRDFYVSGEENLKGRYKTEVSMLRKWKREIIQARHKYYHDLKDLMYSFKENLNFEDLYELDSNCKKNIKDDMPCIYEYYTDITKLAREYKRICKLSKLLFSVREELKEEFIRQLVLRDN